MKSASEKSTTDWLSLLAFLAIAALVVMIFYIASSYPGPRQLLTVVIVGLGASGMILFRQTRKTTNSLITGEARAHYTATHDPLTQLPNKALLLDRLNAAFVAMDGKTPGVLCIGIDRFEEVNETLGYGAGDEVIREIAERLLSICPEGGTLARVSDDTFTLLWASATEKKVAAVADVMIRLLSAPCAATAGARVRHLLHRRQLPHPGPRQRLRSAAPGPARPVARQEGRRRPSSPCSIPKWTRPCAPARRSKSTSGSPSAATRCAWSTSPRSTPRA